MKKRAFSIIFCLLFSFTSWAQTVYFTSDITEACKPAIVNFTNETHQNIDTTNLKFIWSFGDESDDDTTYHSSHVFTQAGFYTVYVYADSLGKYIDGYTTEIAVYGSPESFYPDDSASFCPNENIEFYIDASYQSVNWDFNDGSSDDNSWNHIEHSFSIPDYYNVELIIENSCGIDTIQQVVEISNGAIPQPEISSVQSNICQGDTIYFDVNKNAPYYYWEFGDGGAAVGKTTEYHYSAIGSYWVKAEVTNICGNTGIDSSLIEVGTDVSVESEIHWQGASCPNSNVRFSSNVVGSHKWDFGNGFTSTEHFPLTSFPDTGNYTVSLIASNGCGNSDTSSLQLNIKYDTNYRTEVAIGFRDNTYQDSDTIFICPGSEVDFRNESNNNNGAIFKWYFGNEDSIQTSIRDISFTFNTGGEKEILLVAKHHCGGIDTARKWIFVTDTLSPNPSLLAIPTVICPGENVYFFDDNAKKDNLYSIWFGDGFYVQDVGPENDSLLPVTARHTYHNLGYYNYTFSVTNTCGITETYNDSILVNDTLGYSFLSAFSDYGNTPDNPACPNNMIEYFGIGGTSVVWDFENGVYDTNTIGHHSYPEAGVYFPSAIFTTGCGVIDTVPVPTFIGYENIPDSHFGVSYTGGNLCVGDTVEFEYLSREDESLTYIWHFGDGDSSTIRNPIHVYDTIGTFDIELHVSNGCGSSYRSESLVVTGIYINDNNILLTAPNCATSDGAISGLTSTGSPVHEVVWRDANLNQLGTSLDIDNLSAGEYSVTVSDKVGCTVVAGPYQLNNVGAPAAPIVDDPAPYCENEELNLLTATAQSSGALTWYSDPGLSNTVGTGTSYSPATGVSTSYYVTETTGNCEGPSTEVKIEINPTYIIPDTVYICNGSTFFAEGAFQDEPGIYYDTLTSTLACDSIRVNTIIVLPVARHGITRWVCSGEKYFVEGAWQNEEGVYFDTLLSVNGCDSIVETDLRFKPKYSLEYEARICSGDSTYIEGEWRKTSGTYIDNYTSSLGCDSIVTTNLIVGDVHINTSYALICEGDSIHFEGKWFNSQGIYNDTTVSGTSCDSINQLILDVGENYTANISKNICPGDSVKLEGKWRKTSGSYYDTLLTITGCDSVIITNLGVLDSHFIPYETTICNGDSILIDNVWRKTAGIYYEHFNNSQGCDSITATTLLIDYYADFGDKSVSICSGDSVWIESEWQKVNGTYKDTIAGPLCDSIFTINLQIINPITSVVNKSICAGDSVYMEGDWQKLAGTYYDTVVGSNNCDSIINTELIILPNSSSTEEVWICPNDSVLIGDNWVKEEGTYIHNLSSANGCDSIINTTVQINELCYDAVRNQQTFDWSLYPNPAGNTVVLKTDKKTSEDLFIISLTGQIVYRSKTSEKEQLIDLTGLPPGIYNVHYNGEVQKLIINQ